MTLQDGRGSKIVSFRNPVSMDTEWRCRGRGRPYGAGWEKKRFISRRVSIPAAPSRDTPSPFLGNVKDRFGTHGCAVPAAALVLSTPSRSHTQHNEIRQAPLMIPVTHLGGSEAQGHASRDIPWPPACSPSTARPLPPSQVPASQPWYPDTINSPSTTGRPYQASSRRSAGLPNVKAPPDTPAHTCKGDWPSKLRQDLCIADRCFSSPPMVSGSNDRSPSWSSSVHQDTTAEPRTP